MSSDADAAVREADLARVVAAATVSNFGSMLTRIALPFVAVDVLAASAEGMAALSAARILPALALGLVAASWIEGRRKRRVLIGADLVHAALLCGVPAAFVLGALSLPLLLVFAFASGLVSLAFEVARHAYVAALMPREALVRANARLTAGNAASETLAFAAGGWLVQLLSAPFALLADALSYLGSAACLASIRTREAEPSAGGSGHAARGIGPGLRAIGGDAQLRSLATLAAAGVLANEALGVVYMLFVRRELGFAPGTLGLLFAVGSVAALASSFVAAWVGRRLGPRGAIALGLGGAGLAVGALALAPGATWLGAVLIAVQQLGDAGFVVAEIHALSLRQAAAPREMQARVHGAFSTLASAAMLVGAGLGGVLGAAFGARATIALVSGALVALALAWLAFAPRARPAA